MCEELQVQEKKEETPLYTCALCEREVPQVTKHHLVPCSRGGKELPTIKICQLCHGQIHAIFTNRELDKYLNTVGALKNHPRMEKFLVWAKKQNVLKRGKIRQSNSRGQKWQY